MGANGHLFIGDKGKILSLRAQVGFGPGEGQYGIRFRLDRDGADRDGVPPGDHRLPPGHRAERHGKARAAATRPGESRTRAPGRRARR